MPWDDFVLGFRRANEHLTCYHTQAVRDTLQEVEGTFRLSMLLRIAVGLLKTVFGPRANAVDTFNMLLIDNFRHQHYNADPDAKPRIQRFSYLFEFTRRFLATDSRDREALEIYVDYEEPLDAISVRVSGF